MHPQGMGLAGKTWQICSYCRVDGVARPLLSGALSRAALLIPRRHQITCLLRSSKHRRQRLDYQSCRELFRSPVWVQIVAFLQAWLQTSLEETSYAIYLVTHKFDTPS